MEHQAQISTPWERPQSTPTPGAHSEEVAHQVMHGATQPRPSSLWDRETGMPVAREPLPRVLCYGSLNAARTPSLSDEGRHPGGRPHPALTSVGGSVKKVRQESEVCTGHAIPSVYSNEQGELVRMVGWQMCCDSCDKNATAAAFTSQLPRNPHPAQVHTPHCAPRPSALQRFSVA